jgi:hypothetical protein
LRSDFILCPKNVENFILGIKFKLFLDDPELVLPGFELFMFGVLRMNMIGLATNMTNRQTKSMARLTKSENLLAD